MSNYSLKNKIQITNDFLEEIIAKTWQDIENIKAQIANIDTSTSKSKSLLQLLDNLLTSYYIFTGGVESLLSDNDTVADEHVLQPELINDDKYAHDDVVFNVSSDTENVKSDTNTDDMDFEPFEYFVDFDEPVGEPLSDKDLYI